MPDEPVVFKPKKIPTRVKHFILENYLSAWGGIIVQTNPRPIRLRFVDTFCGSGLYQPDPEITDDPDAYEIGSAILGPTALRKLVEFGRSKGREMNAKALLINKEKRELETVNAALPAEVRAAVDVQVRIQRFDDVKDEAVAFCKNCFSFVLIDPYGPTIAYTSVREIVCGQFTDTLINFPFLTLQKWSGFLFKANPSEEELSRLAAVDAFMGGPEWRELARRSKTSREPLEKLLLDHYVSQLKAEGVHVLALPISFHDINRVLYHLIFTTHNVAGLAAAKRDFVKAKDHEIRLRAELEVKKTRQSSLGFMSAPTVPQTDAAALADRLFARFAGTQSSFADVVLWGLDQCALEADVKKALTVLKQAGKASYVTPRYGQTVTFPKK